MQIQVLRLCLTPQVSPKGESIAVNFAKRKNKSLGKDFF